MPPAAVADVGLTVTPQFPASVVVGQTNLQAGVQITNVSTPPENSGTVTLNYIYLDPSCGKGIGSPGNCPGFEELGTVRLGATASGAPGTACAGLTFTITPGFVLSSEVAFQPSAPVVLTAPGTPDAICGIDFSFSVLRRPGVVPSDLPIGGTLQFAAVGGTASDGVTGSATGASEVFVAPGAPMIETMVGGSSGEVGGPITDTAFLAPAGVGGRLPTGTITFSICGGPGVFSSTVALTDGAARSDPFTPTLPGTYEWAVSYGGDNLNAPATSGCGDPNETAVVTAAAPTIATSASATPLGGISDSAIIAGGFNPTGMITYSVFGPGNPTCTGTPVFTSTLSVTGNGVYQSAALIATAAGTYNWQASYSGDASNLAANSGCGQPGSHSR